MNSNHNQATDGEAKAKPEVIKLGLDLHARQVTECRQLDGSTPKPAQKWNPWKLLNQVEEWVKAGIKVYSCYEARNFSLSDSRRSSFYSSGSSNRTFDRVRSEIAHRLPNWIPRIAGADFERSADM